MTRTGPSLRPGRSITVPTPATTHSRTIKAGEIRTCARKEVPDADRTACGRRLDKRSGKRGPMAEEFRASMIHRIRPVCDARPGLERAAKSKSGVRAMQGGL